MSETLVVADILASKITDQSLSLVFTDFNTKNLDINTNSKNEVLLKTVLYQEIDRQEDVMFNNEQKENLQEEKKEQDKEESENEENDDEEEESSDDEEELENEDTEIDSLEEIKEREEFLKARKEQIASDPDNAKWYSTENPHFDANALKNQGAADSLMNMILSKNSKWQKVQQAYHYRWLVFILLLIIIGFFFFCILFPQVLFLLHYFLQTLASLKFENWISKKKKPKTEELKEDSKQEPKQELKEQSVSVSSSLNSDPPLVPPIINEKEEYDAKLLAAKFNVKQSEKEFLTRIFDWCCTAISTYALLFFFWEPRVSLIRCWIVMQVISAWIIISGQAEKNALFYVTLMCWIPQVLTWTHPESNITLWWTNRILPSSFIKNTNNNHNHTDSYNNHNQTIHLMSGGVVSEKLEWILVIATLIIYAPELVQTIKRFLKNLDKIIGSYFIKKTEDKILHVEETKHVFIIIHTIIQLLVLIFLVQSQWIYLYVSFLIVSTWAYWQLWIYNSPLELLTKLEVSSGLGKPITEKNIVETKHQVESLPSTISLPVSITLGILLAMALWFESILLFLLYLTIFVGIYILPTVAPKFLVAQGTAIITSELFKNQTKEILKYMKPPKVEEQEQDKKTN